MDKNSNFSQYLMDLIKRRRSVRIFNGQKIPQKDILEIVEAGIWAPTGCNNQELRFLILEKEEELKGVFKFKPFFRSVSHFILIFCDMSLPMSQKMYIQYKYEKHLCYIDTGLALMNMVLYAKSKNIDSCICNLSEYHFSRIKRKTIFRRILNRLKLKMGLYELIENNFEFYLRNELKIPKHFKIMCGLALGYAKVYPDIHKEFHGCRKVMRDSLETYIIKKD